MVNACRFLPIALLLTITGGRGQPAPPADEPLMKTVKDVEGKHGDARRDVVLEQLRGAGVTPLRMPFTSRDTIQGENLVVRLGSGSGHLVVGAHYDAVPAAPGANDNGGGIAVVLQLIRTLRNFPFRHQVDFCFFDREEDGLLGSHAYVHQRDTTERFVGMINLDVEGTGTQLYVGPVGGGDDDRLMPYLHAARDSLRYSYTEDSAYPGSDHESFAQAKLENISISVTPEGDGAKLAKWARSGYRPFRDPADIPKVLNVMHSPRDSSTFMTSEALRMSYEFTKLTLLLLDEGEK